MAEIKLGDLERRVLIAILQLQGRGYAVSIATNMRERFGKTISLGAIYATVDRLEKKRFVSSRLGEPTPERGGKPKRFYQIEALGQMALSETREAESRIWAEVPPTEALA